MKETDLFEPVKLEQPQKYHWRKKKEHLAWFESGGYLEKAGDRIYLTKHAFFVPCILHGESIEVYREFTKQQARDLLKDDFDKFEKVECE